MRLQRNKWQRERDENLALAISRGAITPDEALYEQQIRYGMCSTTTCALPIAGQCDECRLSLCDLCLTRHERSGCSSDCHVVDADPPYSMRAITAHQQEDTTNDPR